MPVVQQTQKNQQNQLNTNLGAPVAPRPLGQIQTGAASPKGNVQELKQVAGPNAEGGFLDEETTLLQADFHKKRGFLEGREAVPVSDLEAKGESEPLTDEQATELLKNQDVFNEFLKMESQELVDEEDYIASSYARQMARKVKKHLDDIIKGGIELLEDMGKSSVRIRNILAHLVKEGRLAALDTQISHAIAEGKASGNSSMQEVAGLILQKIIVDLTMNDTGSV